MNRIKLQLTSADIPRLLEQINSRGITVYRVEMVDDMTADLEIDPQFYDAVLGLTHYGCEVKLLQDGRIPYTTLLKRRWVLMAGVIILLVLTVFLPTRVLFFQVEGNHTLPDKLILEKASQCGIAFGAARREVRSEQVKNQLLQLIPQLQWAGINTAGCVATISVQEREIQEPAEQKPGIGNIVSSRDGVIQSVTVLQGNALCKVGQAVKKGEILISGYTDCGNLIRAEAAAGEVYGLTNRAATVVMARQGEKKGTIISQKRKFALLIGKKRINLYKDSGILDGTCDKMYLYSYVTLPGGFELPLAVIEEHWITYQTESYTTDEEDAELLLDTFSREYLLSQMVAGQIMDAQRGIEHNAQSSKLSGSYACSEMIGQILYEETFTNHGENN